MISSDKIWIFRINQDILTTENRIIFFLAFSDFFYNFQFIIYEFDY